ncbi:MAG: TonB-dependent receptor [Gammaproteobacteria bacterium]|nr:MAG: TonB-dependent receptor [Gammaproteobacteria bacterium]
MCRSDHSTWTAFCRVMTGFIVAIVLAVPAGAQEMITEQEMLGEIPLVISASRLAQPITEAPAAITIIDQEMIEASGARNLVDVFRLVPGFVTANWDGNRAVVAPYGLVDIYARRMQVLIDGRSVYMPDFGGVTWSDLPLALDDIERIEAVRGPNAVTYGANSFLGVINIITKTAAETRGTYVKLTTGSQGTRDALLRYGGVGVNLDYRLTLGYQKDTGFDDVVDNRRAPFFDSRLDYRFSDRTTINVKLGAIGGELGEGEDANLLDPPRDETISSNYQHIWWTYKTDNAGEFSLQYYHNYHDSRDSFTTDPILIPPGISTPLFFNYDVTSERHDLEFQHKFGVSRFLRLVWGASGRQDKVTGEKLFNTESRLENNLSRFFVNSEWRLHSSLLFQAGVMLERTTITDSELLPRVAINYHITPQHTIRVGYSEATRNPVLIEEKAEARLCAPDLGPNCSVYDPYLRSSGGLVPEKIAAKDISYLAQLSDSFSFDLRLFQYDIEKLVDWVEPSPPADDVTGSVLDWVNADYRVVLEGAELQASYSPDINNRLMVSYAYTDIDSGKDTTKRNYTASVPQQVASLLAIHNFQDGLTGSIGYYFLDQLKHLDGDFLDERRQLDIRISRQISLGSSEATISAVAQNALDDYKEYRDSNLVSTRYYINFALSFK